MTSVSSSLANTKLNTFYVNDQLITPANKYDSDGVNGNGIFIIGVDTKTNKSHVSISNLLLTDTNTRAMITCDTANTSYPDRYWNEARGLWLVTNDTYPNNLPLTITFNSPNVAPSNDWYIALINASLQPDGAGTSNIPGSYPYLTFWSPYSQSYNSSTIFTFEYDGAGTTTFKADGITIGSPHTDQSFPDGIKLYIVFDDGVPDNRVFTVNLTLPVSKIPIPAFSTLYKSMGKTYNKKNETYIKIQNTKNVNDTFYFKAQENTFLLLNA